MTHYEEALSFIRSWNVTIPGEEKLTEALQGDCARLASTFLRRGGEYELEKFMKSYCQPMQSLWQVRLRAEGIDQKSLARIRDSGHRVLFYDDLHDRAVSYFEGDLRRWHRHWATFLPAVGFLSAENVPERP